MRAGRDHPSPQIYIMDDALQCSRPAARKAAESLFSHFPGLSEKVTYEKWLEERNVLQEQAFRSVEPMRGAIALVKGLVGLVACLLPQPVSRLWLCCS